ncbi:YhbY family RNA-binding protein [Paludicola sp. MB14-C6]|uniref:YhbY family RNA-binding protein n=1 Tax=Paludihabitans sp. MB14-C6 TaxID=3070656 RepID=UPI0027DB0DDE|nr:YhbY family RNA-binding protein [Paludicola sp. MB14-C6]WMJ23680.1 YhbY family RNA-binding protein [Paludicola sp. MB14-C6]
MITTKQRATLRGHANKLEVILHIGKSGVTPTVIVQAKDALVAREMIKGKVQDNAMLSAQEVANELAESTGAEIVQVIGSKFVLYKKNPKNPVYEI